MGKEYLKVSIYAGLAFGFIMGLFFMIVTFSLLQGLKAFIFSAFFFGLILYCFIYYQSRIFKKHRKDHIGEKTIVYEGGANHFRGGESVGGWLYLTENELIFKSHNINIQNHQQAISLSRITDIKTTMTLGIVPNGLIVSVNDENERFVVFNRKEWIQKINEARGTLDNRPKNRCEVRQ